MVESYVTSPIEEAIQGVKGVKKISSESSEGASNITVELEPEADVTMARLEIHERLELIRKGFPIGVTSPFVSNYQPPDLQEEALLTYTFSGPYTPGSLTRIARDKIQPRLSTVPGVSSVKTMGSAETRVSVIYDPVRLRQLDLSPELLAAAIQDARVVRALGDEQRGTSVIAVALRDQPSVLSDLENLAIRAPSGRVFRLGELAAVRPEEDTGGQFFRINGRTAVGFRVFRDAGADAIKTAARIKAAVNELVPGLPPGIGFQLISDESKDLAKQLRDLTLRGGIAFLAVMLVLAVALRNLTSIWLVMGSAGVAIAGTALGLYLLEIPANLLTLAGLGMGIGVLVQNGLVVVERLRHADDTPEGRAQAGRRITPAVLGSTLTTAVVLFPFLYLQGDARAAFVPFAAAFAMGLGWSVLSSLVMIPAVGAGHGLARRRWRRLQRVYVRMLLPLLRWRWVTVGVVAVLLGIAGWGFATKVPRANWGDWFGQRSSLRVFISFPHGSDPESVDRAIAEFEQIAVGRPGVERVDAQSFGSVGAGGVNVLFTREGGFTSVPLVMQEEMTQRAVLIGGATISVSGQGPAFFSGGGASSVSFRIKILGYSFAGVEQLARDLQARLERIPRVREVNINAGSFFGRERSMSVTLEPDRDAIARAGITTSDFARAVTREVSGSVGGTKLELEGEEVTVTLKAKGARERSLLELSDAIVPNPGNAPVRIADLADLGEREGLGRITREDQQYVRIVSYDFRGPPKLANRTHDAFMASIGVPPGYSVGDEKFEWQTDDSGKGLWIVFGAGVVLVVLSVAFVFDSVWATRWCSSGSRWRWPAWPPCSGPPARRSPGRRRWA